MALRPYSANLQQAFRETLGTPGAPEVIDDGQSVVPVAVVAQVNTASSSSFSRITDGIDTAGVTTQGSLSVAPYPADATLINAVANAVATGATIYTVTTGKTFVCTSILIGISTTASSFTIRTGGTVRVAGVLQAPSSVSMNGYLFTATSGQIIDITHGAGAGNGFVTLVGYEI